MGLDGGVELNVARGVALCVTVALNNMASCVRVQARVDERHLL
jgi:hypothetical protein